MTPFLVSSYPPSCHHNLPNILLPSWYDFVFYIPIHNLQLCAMCETKMWSSYGKSLVKGYWAKFHRLRARRIGPSSYTSLVLVNINDTLWGYKDLALHVLLREFKHDQRQTLIHWPINSHLLYKSSCSKFWKSVSSWRLGRQSFLTRYGMALRTRCWIRNANPICTVLWLYQRVSFLSSILYLRVWSMVGRQSTYLLHAGIGWIHSIFNIQKKSHIIYNHTWSELKSLPSIISRVE